MSASQFEFDRYINGVLMAEGVTIERQASFEDAARVAARIASRGPNGEVPVLVLRVARPPAGYSIVHKDEIHAPSVERADAFEQVAKWHDKHSRSAREIADDFRVGPDIQAKALVAANHHAASAAAIRNKMSDERRAALRELMKEVGR